MLDDFKTPVIYYIHTFKTLPLLGKHIHGIAHLQPPLHVEKKCSVRIAYQIGISALYRVSYKALNSCILIIVSITKVQLKQHITLNPFDDCISTTLSKKYHLCLMYFVYCMMTIGVCV